MKKLFPQCNALDDNGKRCRQRSAIKMDYFGNPEMYPSYNDKCVGWVRVNFCPTHFIATGGSFLTRKQYEKINKSKKVRK